MDNINVTVARDTDSSNSAVGVGSKLLEAAETRLAELGYAEILLWTFEKNPRARRFYEKQNFIFDDTYKDSGFENSRKVRYRKRIPG